jgi:putative ubiquitin-RnfH superfamily antitoxin RatB of RatAB toxin-antitoxin module
MKVSIFSAIAGLQQETLELPQGSTLTEALARSSLAQLATYPYGIAVWGKAKPLETVLNEGDRIELLEPLQIDPKEARRMRERRSTQNRALKQQARQKIKRPLF